MKKFSFLFFLAFILMLGNMQTANAQNCDPLSALGSGGGTYFEDGLNSMAVLLADGTVDRWFNGAVTNDYFNGSGTTMTDLYVLERHVFAQGADGMVYHNMSDVAAGSYVQLNLGSPIATIAGDHNNALIVLEDGRLVGYTQASLGTANTLMVDAAIDMGGIANQNFVAAYGGYGDVLFAQKADGTMYEISVTSASTTDEADIDGTLTAYPAFDNALKIVESIDSNPIALMPNGNIVSYLNGTVFNGQTYVDITSGDAFENGWPGKYYALTSTGEVYESNHNTSDFQSIDNFTQVIGLSGIDALVSSGGDVDHFIAVDFATNTAYDSGSGTTVTIPVGYTISAVRAYYGMIVFALENSSGDIEIWGANDSGNQGTFGSHFASTTLSSIAGSPAPCTPPCSAGAAAPQFSN